MIITHSADLDEGPLLNSALNGVQLTNEEQFAGFTVHEARIEAGATAPLRSPDARRCAHVYYCIGGRGTCSATGGGDHERDVRPDTVMALSSDQAREMKVSAEGAMRLFVVYIPDAEAPRHSLAIVRRLDEVEGTDRDVDWGLGRSLQHLLRLDGFPLGISKTTLRPGASLRIGHPHHVEGVYYMSGRVAYRWRPAGASECTTQSRVDALNGSLFLLSDHDKHSLENEDAPANCISFWYPPLSGDEGRITSDDGYSGFDAN